MPTTEFQSLPPDELRRAASAVADVYHGLRDTLARMGRETGMPLTYWEGARSQREDYFQGILDRLPELCRQQRIAEEAGAAKPPA